MHDRIFFDIDHYEPLSKIISIGTALPAYCHRQMDIFQFMQTVYGLSEPDRRKLRFMYLQSGISQRYSVLPDYSKPIQEWRFYPQTENLEPFPSLEKRMMVYNRQAPLLSVDAVRDCLNNVHDPKKITHLITVSCTGMSAPGLDLQLMELMDLPKQIFRSSINFMGCYAAVHALKIADAFCRSDKNAQVLIVCTELCTLHFQREATMDNMASSLLFGDGSSAALVTADGHAGEGLRLDSFYSEIIPKGRRDMAWELSSTGFLMTLSGYIPELIQEDFAGIVDRAMGEAGNGEGPVTHWCIHPGGKKILDAIHKSMRFTNGQLDHATEVLNEVGNLSSATILFVLKKMMKEKKSISKLLAAAFGPGLTVETFTAHYV